MSRERTIEGIKTFIRENRIENSRDIKSYKELKFGSGTDFNFPSAWFSVCRSTIPMNRILLLAAYPVERYKLRLEIL